MLNLPPLYAITDKVIGDSPISCAKLFLRSHIKLIQLRWKEMTDSDLLKSAIEIKRMCIDSGALLIINDRLDIALLSDADGLHVGDKDISPEECRRLLGDDKTIGVSTHSLNEAKLADNYPIQYIAVGPISKTKTKNEIRDVVPEEEWEKIPRIVKKPLVAIGGIDINIAGRLFKAGFNSVAMISSLARQTDLKSYTSEINRAWRSKK